MVPLFREQIRQGGPVTVTHPEVERYFMTIPEAAQLVIQASAMAQGGDVFLLDMGEPVRIIDLARRMIQPCRVCVCAMRRARVISRSSLRACAAVKAARGAADQC